MSNPPTFRAESFVPFRRPEMVWDEFVIWWVARWPRRILPCQCGLHNLRELTGLSDTYLEAFLLERTPVHILPPLRGVAKL